MISFFSIFFAATTLSPAEDIHATPLPGFMRRLSFFANMIFSPAAAVIFAITPPPMPPHFQRR
jgi:hypothetical protein